MERKANLTEGPIGRRLFYLTVPMVMGIFAMVAFNLADTYFVAQLGTAQLAAMSFTFPVVMLVHSLAFGLGTGTGRLLRAARSLFKKLSNCRVNDIRLFADDPVRPVGYPFDAEIRHVLVETLQVGSRKGDILHSPDDQRWDVHNV